MDELFMNSFKNDVKEVTCPHCHGRMKVIIRTEKKNKAMVCEFSHLLLTKVENHETLYLRDTSKQARERIANNVNGEILRVIRWSNRYSRYIDDSTGFVYEKNWIVQTILGKNSDIGLEFIDIYGSSKIDEKENAEI